MSASGRRNVMLGTAGHVDHGKTALVKLLTGCETDTLAEERARGLTIDVGFAPCRLANERVVGVVDVPGHVDFIRNMVAGAQGIDVAILVVAADDGVMPQTREHLNILKLMGLRHGLVALTKIDLVDVPRREQVMADLGGLLAGGFLEGAPICPISTLTGAGYDAFFTALNEVVNRCEDRSDTGTFRLWVDDAFSIRGAGTIITGIPARGIVHLGDNVHLRPGSLSGHVRRLQVYGTDAEAGRAGECVALNIPEIDPHEVHRGLVLTSPEPALSVAIAEAGLQILESVRSPIPDYSEIQLHVGTAAVTAHAALLEADEIHPGQSQLVQLRLDAPLPLLPGERFIVRATIRGHQLGLTTIGGGRILGVSNARLRRKKPWILERLTARRQALDDVASWCELMVREHSAPVSKKELESGCALRPEEVKAIVAVLHGKGRLLETRSGSLAHPQNVQQLSVRLLAAIKAFHASHPQHLGVESRSLLPQAAGSAEMAELALACLIRGGQVEAHGTVLAARGWKAQVPDCDARLCAEVEEAFRRGGWSSPDLSELAASLRQGPEKLRKLASLLAERGALVKLDERIWMHRDAIARAQDVVLELFRRAPSFSTMDFRDALGVSRKFAVPLLDHLDRLRFTVRSGHERTPGAEAKRRLAA